MVRRTRPFCIASFVGLCCVADALADSRIDVQVSRGLAEDWHSSITASPGDRVDIRVVFSYNGTSSPLGLAACIFQPTLSNWRAGGDTVQPLVNGGVGGQVTTPIGAVGDLPGQYGRVIPYAQVGMSSTTFLMGHVNMVAGVSYLRIAQSQVTS